MSQENLKNTVLQAESVNRRSFIKQAGAFATAGILAPNIFLPQNAVAQAHKKYSANEKLNIAVIGSGGRGRGNIDGVKSQNIIALCDVDWNRASDSFKQFPHATRYKDFRIMLEKEKSIDAVIVATPDHTHAVAAARAMKLGKHVYCEKPLTYSVFEARTLRELAAETGVATQMGNQGTANTGLREAVEVVQSGGIGDVTEVHVWTNRPVWPQGSPAPTEAQTPPDGLDWDLWLGPAKERPYHSSYLPFSWRGWSDFGTGALGDMACHTANMAFMALKLGYPTWARAMVATDVNPDSYPSRSRIHFKFPKRSEMPEVDFYWYDGGELPPRYLAGGVTLPEKLSSSGSVLVGSKGALFSPNDYGAQFSLLPEANFKDYKKPDAWLPRSPGHHNEWIEACKGGPAAMSNFSYAGLLTESILLGNVAMRARTEIAWDGPNMKVTNNEAANALISREYRKGWEL